MAGSAPRLPPNSEPMTNVTRMAQVSQSDNQKRLTRTLSRKSLTAVAQPARSKIPKHDKSKEEAPKTQAGNSTSGRTEIDDNQQPPPGQKPRQRRSTSRGAVSQVFVKERAEIRCNKPQLSVSSAAATLTNLGCQQNHMRVLENRFNSKKHNYTSLKSLITDKLKLSEMTFEELLAMREQILALGGKDPGSLASLAPIPPWSAQQLSAKKKGPQEEQLRLDYRDDSFVEQLEAELKSTLDCLLGLCAKALTQHSSALGSLLELNEHASTSISAGIKPSSCLENMKQELSDFVERHLAEGREFEAKIEASSQEQTCRMGELVQCASCLWHELRVQKQQPAAVAEATFEGGAAASSYLSVDQQSQQHQQQLQSERMRSLRARTRLRELEAELKQVQEMNKQLEAQLKQKEASCEQRSKELARCQRTSEQAFSRLEKQKEALEHKLSEVREDMNARAGSRNNTSQSLVAEDKERIHALENELESEKCAREEVNAAYRELRAKNEKLEEKCKQILKIQERAKNLVPNDKHTEYEIQLYNDLKGTEKVLAEKEELIKKLQAERAEIMAAAAEEMDDDEREASKQRLTADLLRKSNELEAMTSEFTCLQKNYKKLQQKNDRLEHSLAEMKKLQSQLRDSGGSKGCHEAQLFQLQQQIMDLRSNLSEARSHNAELEKNCSRLQLKLVHQERLVRDLKVRGELRQLLNPSEPPEHQRQPGSPRTNDIDEELQHLHDILESKDMQINKLEKLVKQMERQEEYLQQQRTRLEGRIAKLDMILKESEKTHRNRGFSFL